MSRSRISAVLRAALAAAVIVALAAALAPAAQRGSAPVRSRVASYTDMLLRFVGKPCQLSERVLAPDSPQRHLVLTFEENEGEAARDALTLEQVGSDFVLLRSADKHELYLPHGMAALLLPP